MKQFLRRSAALFLAAALLVTTAAASYALGDELHQTVTPLADGVTLTKQLFWSNSQSNLRTENYLTYTPGSAYSPAVSFGSSMLSKQTVSTLAKDLESGGQRVLGGINGDYFDMATGNPLGLVVTDGVLRSSSAHFSAVGFLPDGSAMIGTPELSIMAKFSGYCLKVSDVNKVRTSTGGYYLLSEDFGATTANTQPGIDVVLSPVRENLGTEVPAENGQTVTQSDVLKIGSRVSCKVEAVYRSTGSVPIPPGQFVLTINEKSGPWLQEVLGALVPGDSMDFEITSPDTRWNQAENAIGAYNRLLTGGTVTPGLDAAAADRTAIGVRPDGTVIFYTIDGRQAGYSIGATLTQVASRLAELGCSEAVAVDGGGSTTLGATTPDGSSFTGVNQPSGGAQRAVSNALFLVSNLSPSGLPARLHVTPQHKVLLGGATTTATAAFVDSNWYPTSGGEEISWAAQYGSFDAAGIYTAPSSSVVDTLTATTPSGLQGSATVTVIASPNGIAVASNKSGKDITALSLSAGEMTELTARAIWKLIPLKSEPASFTWSLSDPKLGTLTDQGVFTAGTQSASGTIKVAAGNFAVTLPVSVSSESRFDLLDDFEGATAFTAGPGSTLQPDRTADSVRFGSQSLRWTYTPDAGSIALSCNLPLEDRDNYLSLWVYGDNSGNTLGATCLDASGASHSLTFGALNFSGWKQLWATLPAGASHLTKLSLTGSAGGAIWLDQLTASNQTQTDTTPPQVTLTVSGSQVSAKITDNTGAAFLPRQLSLLLDGAPLFFTPSTAGDGLTASLSSLSQGTHRITVIATDASGNIGRASQTLSGQTAPSAFKDMSGHWAAPYTDYLSGHGVVSGVTEVDGSYFYPDRSITRGDFALMTARWMGLDLNSYAGVSLPFADTASIPAWSQNAVKAMYAQGIMKGSSSGGKLYGNAAAPITRAEAMTILGRIQEKGYPEASLQSFTDAADLPTWAKPYVASLVGQKVVGGYQGLLRPGDCVSRAEVSKMLQTIW